MKKKNYFPVGLIVTGLLCAGCGGLDHSDLNAVLDAFYTHPRVQWYQWGDKPYDLLSDESQDDVTEGVSAYNTRLAAQNNGESVDVVTRGTLDDNPYVVVRMTTHDAAENCDWESYRTWKLVNDKWRLHTPWALFSQIDALWAQRRIVESIELMEKYLQNDPNQVEVLRGLWMAYEHMEKRGDPRATKALLSIVKSGVGPEIAADVLSKQMEVDFDDIVAKFNKITATNCTRAKLASDAVNLYSGEGYVGPKAALEFLDQTGVTGVAVSLNKVALLERLGDMERLQKELTEEKFQQLRTAVETAQDGTETGEWAAYWAIRLASAAKRIGNNAAADELATFALQKDSRAAESFATAVQLQIVAEEYERNRVDILSGVNAALEAGAPEKADATLGKFANLQLRELREIRMRVQTALSAKRKADAIKEALGEIKKLGAFEHDKLADLYSRLSQLDPVNMEYVGLAKQHRDAVEAEKERVRAAAVAEEARKAAEAKQAEQRKEFLSKQFSPWDGSHRKLEELIKKAMNDPDSYKHDDTKYWDHGDYLVVETSYRGKNAFGGMVRARVSARVDPATGDILKILSEE